jgi:hypothetical protein
MTAVSGPPAGGAPDTFHDRMSDDGPPDAAQLALTKVRIGGRAADFYVYDDRLVVTTVAGERVIAMSRLERVATRRNWRGSVRVRLALSDDEVLEISGLNASSASVAHRTIVGIARRFH